MKSLTYSPYGIRTRVTAVKRRCLNPLTNGPYVLMGTSGLEPPTSRLSGVRSNHLSYAPKLICLGKVKICFLKKQCRLHDLNTRPSDYKSDALPTELSRPKVMRVKGLEPPRR